jgi:polysaccharide pyruvyl transferase WcaK-like protein
MQKKISALKNKTSLLVNSSYGSYDIVYVGYVGRNNFGDDLILDIYRKTTQKKVLPVLDQFRLQRKLNSAATLGGGTLIGGEIYLRAFKSLNLIPRQVFCAGVIPGKIDSGWVDLLSEKVATYTRSEESKYKLEKAGIQANAFVDPAVFCPLIYQIKNSEPSGCGKIVFAVHGKYHFIEHIEKIIKNLAPEDKSNILFFSSSPEDVGLAKILAKKYKALTLDGWANVEISLSLLANAKAVFSIRLHPGICAASYGTPVRIIPYDMKHEEFASSIDASGLLIRNSSELKVAVEDVYSESASPSMEKKVQLWHERFNEFKSIFGW